MGCLQGIFHVLYGVAYGSLQLDLVELLNKKVAILSVHNCLNTCSKDLDPIFFKNTFLIQFRTAIQSGLTTEG